MTEQIVNLIEDVDYNMDNANEKVHIMIGIVENFCHEIVYHRHYSLNYDKMKIEVVNLIVNLIKN